MTRYTDNKKWRKLKKGVAFKVYMRYK